MELPKLKILGVSVSYVTSGFLLGLFFVLGAWSIEFIMNDVSFSLHSFVTIHNNPILFIVDASPVVLAYISYLLSKIIGKKEQVLNETIRQQQEEVSQLSAFLMEIGNGNFTVEPNEQVRKSALGVVLIKMKEQLKENQKKENNIRWEEKGKDVVSKILRRYTEFDILAYEVVKTLCEYLKIEQGAFYIYDAEEEIIRNYGVYAYNRKKHLHQEFKIGYGLIGQAAYEKDTVYRTEIPEDYATFTSGLIRDKKPASILIEPLLYNEALEGVLELSSIRKFSDLERLFIKDIAGVIAETLFNLKTNAKTKRLLEKSQQMTSQLQENEEELRQNAEEMRVAQDDLKEANERLEQQIQKVEAAQQKLNLLLENASEVISIYNEDRVLVYESPAAQTILGYDPKAQIGKKGIENIDDTAIVEKFYQAFKKVEKNPRETEEIRFEYLRRDDNQEVWLQTTIRNLLHIPEINGFLLNTRDVTAEIIADREQRKRGEMQALSENSPDMIVRISKDRKFFYSNPSFEHFFGLAKENIENQDLEEVLIDEQFKNILKDALLQVDADKKKLSMETTVEKGDSNYFLTLNIIPEYESKHVIGTYLIVLHDITVRKLFEQEIEKKNKNITESINYAYRIQDSILPDQQILQQYLEKSFMFYKPRDVISGDFPWLFPKGDIIYLAVVDCTGHGVPGALLSFIGYFHLNNIVDHERELSAGEILDELHLKVKQTLRQDVPGATTRDGMDVALCKINLKTKKVEFSGAHRPLYLYRNNELIEFKGDRKAIGGISIKKRLDVNFITQDFEIKTKDRIFIFSDGLPDQLGGENRSKYMNKRIKQLIEDSEKEDIVKLKDVFEQHFNEWKGDEKQVDDVLLIGVEF